MLLTLCFSLRTVGTLSLSGTTGGTGEADVELEAWSLHSLSSKLSFVGHAFSEFVPTRVRTEDSIVLNFSFSLRAVGTSLVSGTTGGTGEADDELEACSLHSLSSRLSLSDIMSFPISRDALAYRG